MIVIIVVIRTIVCVVGRGSVGAVSIAVKHALWEIQEFALELADRGAKVYSGFRVQRHRSRHLIYKG